MGKRMQHGFAARNGVLAATLAAGGYTGIRRVFEREYGGFLSVFGEGHDPRADQITDGLGEVWHTDVIAIKPYAAMAGLHAAIDSARAMLADATVDPAAVESITVSVSAPAFHHGGWRAERPLAAVGAQMNLAYAVAVTLLDGTALAAQFAPSRIDADDVWALIDRTTLRHEPDFDLRLEDGYNTRLEIRLSDGTVRTSFVEQPRGGLLHPLSGDEVVEKFRALTAPLIDCERARAIEEMVLALEQLVDLDDLVALLALAVEPIFGEVAR
jgi:2-methylcitrate dehydratase PrpD